MNYIEWLKVLTVVKFTQLYLLMEEAKHGSVWFSMS
ncbi:hypothetical protein NSND_61934 [Nitrospira sp. ND1]|nr:hypothetical protein NSND_61934 [Nitrospira sp. ND1]